MARVSKNEKNLQLGGLEAHILDTLQHLKSPGIRLQDARRLSPRPKADIQSALSRLVKKGRLVRLGRGRFYLPTVDPARAACHAWAPSYVSFLNVLADAGFTEQIPRRLDLAYAQTIVRRNDWRGLPIAWHPIPPESFREYKADKDGTLTATPAKAASDLVHRQRDFGGITPYRPMVEQALRRRPKAEVDAALEAYRGHSGTIRRLLFLRHGDREIPRGWELRALVHDFDTHNPIPLDSSRRGAKARVGGILNLLEDAS